MRALAVLLSALAWVTGAAAHGGAGAVHDGFVSTVSTVEPPVPGLVVRVLGAHDQISVTNLTQEVVVVPDAEGREVTIRPQETGQWADARIVPAGPPEREGVVQNWRIRGTIGGRPFEILGFLGYRGPIPVDSAVPVWAVVLLGAAGAVVFAAALALPLWRRKGEG